MSRFRKEVWFWRWKIPHISPKSLAIREYSCVFRRRCEEFSDIYKTAKHFKMKILSTR